MKSNLRLGMRLIAILFVLMAGVGKAHAQGTTPPPQPPPPPIPTQNSLTALPVMPGPPIGEQFTELTSGIFSYSKTDLSLPGPMPINVTRVYRSVDQTSSDWNNRAFGVGTRLNYDMFVYNGALSKTVSMPDSSVLGCYLPLNGQPPYVCNSQPSGIWFGSTIDANNNLTRPDGTVYSFSTTTGLLLSITDRFGNSVSITRGSVQENSACHTGSGSLVNVPSGYAASVTSSNGREVYFCYDSTSYPYDITGIADNASGGPIKKVTYTYGAGSVLATVTQNNNSNAITTYQYNQGSPSGVGNLTTIIVNDSCPSSGGCGSPNQVFTYITYTTNFLGTALKSISSQLPGNGYEYGYNSSGSYPASHVTVTLPDNATRDFYFDSQGYVIEDIRNVSGTSPEYTFFDRGQQTVGSSEEFVGEIQEEDQHNNVVRQTTYDYDANGNVKTVILCPAPGQNAATCGSTTPTATWDYTYTTFNRLASFVEPLAYNGVGTTYSYVDPPSTPSMTVTDPIGTNMLTTTYNAQGQPVSIPNALGKYTTVQYYSNGDVESVKDPIGNTTTYTPDADGRITKVTSPLLENTQYAYDAIDDVTQITDPLGHITCNTYDLIGELASTTPPKGVTGSCASVNSTYTTTITRSANLAKTTLTDPLGFNTVTDLDGQGRHTDYTDKRGVETTYAYDKFGRVTEAFFNENNKSPYPQETVQMTSFDALDRVLTITDSLLGNGDSFSYDSLNSTMSASDLLGRQTTSLSYAYDLEGRRTSMQVTVNAVSQQVMNYGYDCDDRLIGMSNNGTAIQSCSPTNSITNGSLSTQFGFYYLGAGVLDWMLAEGVKTVNTVIDNDERTTQRDYYSYPDGVHYGNGSGLTYTYDPDGHLIDKGGFFAAVNIPAAASASYSATDQVTLWNTAATNPDHASNITTDPSGLALTWSARNQLSTVSGGTSENYDGLGRRESSVGSATLNFEHDGSAVIGWTSSTAGAYNFTAMPGGAAVAGSYSLNGTTTTWLPLLDTDGSTLGLVNAANPDSGPVTTYTYDPSGTPAVSGTANDWPFQYQGMEKEFTDPAPYYYNGIGQFYSPQMVRSLAEAGQTSSSGSGGYSPAGTAIAAPSGSSGGLSPQSVENDSRQAFQVGADIYVSINALTPLLGPEAPVIALPLALIGGAIDFLVNFFEDIFGGSGSPEIPRQLLHGRHPLYPVILGVSDDLIPDEVSLGKPQLCGDPHVCNHCPVQRVEDPAPGPQQNQQKHFWQKPGCADALGELGVGAVGTTLTVGSIAAAPYLAPELFEGLEGLDAAGHMGIVAVPGPTLMALGAVGVGQKCF